MRVLVLTSCTDKKAVETNAPLTADDFDDPDRLAAGEARLHTLMRPAGVMYTGKQHVRAMRGVQAMRTELGTAGVVVAIISAGYGVVDENRLIAPYDVTFSGMSASAIRARGARLGIPAAARNVLPGHDVVFQLLGSDYLTSLAPPLGPSGDQRFVCFAKPSEMRIASTSVVIPAGSPEAGRWGSGNIALKGRMLELIGAAVRRDGTQVLERIKADPTPTAITEILDREVKRT
jgi:hypothetical protein